MLSAATNISTHHFKVLGKQLRAKHEIFNLFTTDSIQI